MHTTQGVLKGATPSRPATPGATNEPGYHARVTESIGGRATSVLIGLATSIVMVSFAIVPFLSSPWLAIEQDRAQAPAWTGYTAAELRTATDAIVVDLVFGPPDFDVVVRGEPVLNERERSHMRDVRTIFLGLWGLTIAALVVLAATAFRAGNGRARWYRSVSRGAAGLGIGVVVVGFIAAVAFEPLFAVFHRLFFAGGTYTFDPLTERLVQLFPFAFWQETTIALGILIAALSALVWWVTSRRATREADVHASQSAVPA
jgi:integral membrane protein (TIGR01906 family)